MYDRDSYWEDKLSRTPHPNKRFTSAMMENVEKRLQKSSSTRLGGNIMRSTAILLTLGLLLVIPGILSTNFPGTPPVHHGSGGKPIELHLQSGEGGDISAWEQMNIEAYRDHDQTVIELVIALIRRELAAMGGPSVPSDRLWEDPETKSVLARYDLSSPWVSDAYIKNIELSDDTAMYTLMLTLTDSTQSEFFESIQVDISKETSLIRNVVILESNQDEEVDLDVVPPTKADPVYLLAEDKEHLVTLFGFREQDSGMFSGIEVHYGDDSQRFDQWTNSVSESFYPLLWVTDLTGDGEVEIAIALITGHGTGAHESEMKVLNSKLDEWIVNDPIEAVESLVEAELEIDDDMRTYRIRLGEDERSFSYHESGAGMWFDVPVFGSAVHYRVEQETLYADVSVQVSPGFFPLTATVRYKFESDRFVVEDVILVDTD